MENRIERPFATHYYHNARDGAAAFTGYGAAKTEEGAIRAAVVRVFLGQYAKAVIHDRVTGVALYNVVIGAGGIRVQYGSGVPFKVYAPKLETQYRAHA